MNLEIQSFAESGDKAKERLVLKATADIDVGAYAVFFTLTKNGENPTSGSKKAFWFPDGKVKSGDLVVLYTKSGTTSTKELTEGRTVHFFYWGLGDSIWNTPKSGAVVLMVNNWKWKATPDQ